MSGSATSANDLKIKSKNFKRQVYANLLDTGEGSDIKFIVCGKNSSGEQIIHEFNCHKLILKMGSVIFDSMLFGSRDDVIRLGSVIHLNDTDPEAFNQMIRFFYMKTVRFSSAIEMLSVYKIADQYMVDPLKASILDLITDSRITEAVLIFLDDGISSSNEELQSVLLPVVIGNNQSMLGSDEFGRLDPSKVDRILNCIDRHTSQNSLRDDYLDMFVSGSDQQIATSDYERLVLGLFPGETTQSQTRATVGDLGLCSTNNNKDGTPNANAPNGSWAGAVARMKLMPDTGSNPGKRMQPGQILQLSDDVGVLLSSNSKKRNTGFKYKEVPNSHTGPGTGRQQYQRKGESTPNSSVSNSYTRSAEDSDEDWVVQGPGRKTKIPALPKPKQTGSKDPSAIQSRDVTITNSMAGCLLGLRGVKIHAIEKEAGAEINISPKQGTANRIVTVIGTEEQIDTAIFLMQKCISSDDLDLTDSRA